MATSYELQSSPIWLDVKQILGDGKKPVKFEYRGMIHTEKEDFAVMKIMALDTVRDYANNIGEHLQVKFKIPLGDYMTCLYPFRTNLEFSIKKITLQEQADKKEPETKITIERYKAIFLVDENPIPTGGALEQIDTESLNNMDIVDVKLQLLDRSLEPLRIKTVYGVFRDVSPEGLMRSLFGGESAKVLVDGKPSIDGVNIIEPDNKEKKDHIILPNGTSLKDLPTFLQERMGGVYSTGIGTFLQVYNEKRLWFIYPLFNTSRFSETKDDKLIIYAVPPDQFQGIDRTYMKDGAVLKILATSARKYQDSADIDFMNKGSGFRMADARSFMKKPVKMTEDGPKAVRTQLNHESVMEAREDGLNYAPTSRMGASNNPFAQYSRVAGMQLARVDVTWENSNPDLLYPGMPVKYIFLDNNKPVEINGTLVFSHTVTVLQTSSGINSTIYKNITTLVVLAEQVTIEQKFKNRELPVRPPTGVF